MDPLKSISLSPALAGLASLSLTESNTPSLTPLDTPSLMADIPSLTGKDATNGIGQSILCTQWKNLPEAHRSNVLRRISHSGTSLSGGALEQKEGSEQLKQLRTSQAVEEKEPQISKKVGKKTTHFFGPSFQQPPELSQEEEVLGKQPLRRRSSLPLPVTPRKTPVTPRKSPRISPRVETSDVRLQGRPAVASSDVLGLPTLVSPKTVDLISPSSKSSDVRLQERPAVAWSDVPVVQKAASSSAILGKKGVSVSSKAPSDCVQERASVVLVLNHGVSISYRDCVEIILSAKSCDAGYKRIQETLKAYEGVVKVPFRIFGARQCARMPSGRACLIAMLNYQIIFKEKALFEEESKEESSFDPHVQALITHLNNEFQLYMHGNHKQALQCLDELSKSKRNIAAADRMEETEVFLDEISKFMKCACQYEGLRGERVMLKKARHEMTKYYCHLSHIAKVDPESIFTAFKNDLLVDLSFSGHDFCKGLHDLMCHHLDTEYASENHRFLDAVRLFLTSLHRDHLKDELKKKQIDGHLRSMWTIYNTYVSSVVLNISAGEREYIKQNLDFQSAQHAANKLDSNIFYDSASHLFFGAQQTIKRLISDALRRYKEDPQNQIRLMSLLLDNIAGQ